MTPNDEYKEVSVECSACGVFNMARVSPKMVAEIRAELLREALGRIDDLEDEIPQPEPTP